MLALKEVSKTKQSNLSLYTPQKRRILMIFFACNSLHIPALSELRTGAEGSKEDDM